MKNSQYSTILCLLYVILTFVASKPWQAIAFCVAAVFCMILGLIAAWLDND